MLELCVEFGVDASFGERTESVVDCRVGLLAGAPVSLFIIERKSMVTGHAEAGQPRDL